METEVRHGCEASLARRHAECDGGAAIPGTRFAGRAEFAGRLTGDWVDHGEPPWRWYLLAELSRKPEGWPGDGVWCESESVFLIDERGRTLPGRLPVRGRER